VPPLSGDHYIPPLTGAEVSTVTLMPQPRCRMTTEDVTSVMGVARKS
jgi:hypothetical protein